MFIFRRFLIRALALSGGLIAGSCAASYGLAGPSPFPDGAYVAAVTHWQSGERKVYRSLHVVDPEEGIDFASVEHDEEAWRSVCEASDPTSALDQIRGTDDPASKNANLEAGHGQLPVVPEALSGSVERAISRLCGRS